MFPANNRFDKDVFRLRLQSTSSRRLDRDKYVRPSLTSSRRLGQEQYICLSYTSSRGLPRVFKTSSGVFKVFSRRLQGVFKVYCLDVFKKFLKHLQDVLQRYLQDVFKTHYQVELRNIQHVSETFFSKDGYLLRDLPR